MYAIVFAGLSDQVGHMFLRVKRRIKRSDCRRKVNKRDVMADIFNICVREEISIGRSAGRHEANRAEEVQRNVKACRGSGLRHP